MKICALLLLLFATLSLCRGQKKTSFDNIQVEGVLNPVISLNGTWKFNMDAGDHPWENSVEFEDWADIQVPGECQMQGFAIQHDIPYIYKKRFELPADYSGKQIQLNFHGVYSYARVWVNGTFVREHYGGFTKWSCPISALVKAGESATLTVEIVDRINDISYGSGYAKHQVGGILRDVELVCLPKQNFKQLYFETELDDQYEHAELKLFYELQQDTPAQIDIELFDPRGKMVDRIEKDLISKEGEVTIPVSSPEKWDAEHPRLYTVVSTLIQNGRELYSLSERIGFREVVVQGNKLLVNGSPVKLRGACRHDIHPTLGRMTTPEFDLKDVLLAKECNMNFIRTSHYPPTELFLKYCDQYGIYVEDETAVCFVGSHRTDAYRASGISQDSDLFTERYLSQLEEMVQNHRNHPSVIIWSIGNENSFGKNFTESYNWVKENDSTRPIIYSYPGQVPDSLRNYEILSMHYPSWQGELNQHAIQTHKFDFKQMPVLFDEWAHVACYNNFEIMEDPNVRNFWGQSLDSMWTYLFEAEGGLGGAIWCMLDETFMLPSDLPGFNQWWGILDKKVIPSTYMGPCVGYGEWGIVDTWRRKKPEFWGTKKAYSPTKILLKQVDEFQANRALSLPVYNRFDHTNFHELKIVWSYADQSGLLKGVQIAPHEKGELLIPANSWEPGKQLLIEFYQNDTLLVDKYNLSLAKPLPDIPELSSGSLRVKESEEKYILTGLHFSMDVSKETGLMENVRIKGDLIIESGPYLNLKVPGKRQQYSTIDMEDMAVDWSCKKLKMKLKNGIASFHSQGNYKGIEVDFIFRVDEKGIIEMDYLAEHSIKNKTIQEAGLKFITGPSFNSLSWDRDSYFTSYPDGALGAPQGEANLHFKPAMYYREKPLHSWELDMQNYFYLGIESEWAYSYLARSLKEHIYSFHLITEANSGLIIHSNGTQACRFDLIQGEHTLIVNDQWDYNSLKWGNYMKQIPLESKLSGQVTISLTN